LGEAGWPEGQNLGTLAALCGLLQCSFSSLERYHSKSQRRSMMMSQLHKRFTSDQVQELLERYLKKEVERKYIQETLGISRRRFFMLLKQYREDPSHFTVRYHRTTPPRSLSAEIELNILKKLVIEKKIIRDKEIPLLIYNYSYIKDRLRKIYRQKVSLNTIIHRAKEHGFYLKKPRRIPHDREVLTRYAGELIQHDSCYHFWAPAAKDKWYLITSSDDYSRFLPVRV
jgi:hypothetical protein